VANLHQHFPFPFAPFAFTVLDFANPKASTGLIVATNWLPSFEKSVFHPCFICG
jgi:hypothetical protein